MDGIWIKSEMVVMWCCVALSGRMRMSAIVELVMSVDGVVLSVLRL